jgi:hypothetical protein
MRFPPYPTDILSRADALLSSKYPDGIVDPALAILVCYAIVEERERCAIIAEMHEHRGEIAKAIRGTE